MLATSSSVVGDSGHQKHFWVLALLDWVYSFSNTWNRGKHQRNFLLYCGERIRSSFEILVDSRNVCIMLRGNARSCFENLTDSCNTKHWFKSEHQKLLWAFDPCNPSNMLWVNARICFEKCVDSCNSSNLKVTIRRCLDSLVDSRNPSIMLTEEGTPEVAFRPKVTRVTQAIVLEYKGCNFPTSLGRSRLPKQKLDSYLRLKLDNRSWS